MEADNDPEFIAGIEQQVVFNAVKKTRFLKVKDPMMRIMVIVFQIQ